jgi:hypothetical protein
MIIICSPRYFKNEFLFNYTDGKQLLDIFNKKLQNKCPGQNSGLILFKRVVLLKTKWYKNQGYYIHHTIVYDNFLVGNKLQNIKQIINGIGEALGKDNEKHWNVEPIDKKIRNDASSNR